MTRRLRARGLPGDLAPAADRLAASHDAFLDDFIAFFPDLVAQRDARPLIPETCL
jgi:hypothetical protein